MVVIPSGRPCPVCEGCGGWLWSKGYRTAVLVDRPAGSSAVAEASLDVPEPECSVRSFVEQDPMIGPERALLKSRAARWVTTQVGRRGRPVGEVAEELGLWVAYGHRRSPPLG